MRSLFQYPLCAFSRIVRVTLSEKKLDYTCQYEVPWDVSDSVFEYNVFGTLPVFLDIDGGVIFGNSSIREYIEEIYPEPNLIGEDSAERAESRRIADWFSFVFYNDVYLPIITERITKRFSKNVSNKSADPTCVRSATSKLSMHLEYVSWLIDRRNWLAGRRFSVADIAAASFISVMDYLGVVNWEKHEIAKEWYARIKSRQSFRSILSDNLPQIQPSKDYSNPDF